MSTFANNSLKPVMTFKNEPTTQSHFHSHSTKLVKVRRATTVRATYEDKDILLDF